MQYVVVGRYAADVDLQALPQSEAELAIACVEDWSASAVWSGVRLVDLLRMAGASPDSRVRVESLEPVGAFRSSVLDRARTRDPLTVLARACAGRPCTPSTAAPYVS